MFFLEKSNVWVTPISEAASLWKVTVFSQLMEGNLRVSLSLERSLKIVSLPVNTALKAMPVSVEHSSKLDRCDLSDHSTNLVDQSIHIGKPLPPQICLDPLKEPVICGGKVRGVRRMRLDPCACCLEEVADLFGSMCRCPIMVQDPVVGSPQGWLTSSDFILEPAHHLEIPCTCYPLAIWNKFHQNDALTVKKTNHHDLDG